MAKSSGQKLKLLYLRDILLKKTDETHKMTAAEIIDALNGYGISSERKSLYDDLSLLANYGLDICREKTSTTKYCVASRDFELAELKLLVDNELVGVIADRFGDDVFIVRENENQFRFTARISISSQFYAWVFGLGGGVKILSPKKVADGFKEQLDAVSKNYLPEK